MLMSDSQLCYFFSYVVMLHNFILIWFLSVFRLYEIRNFEGFFLLGIIFVIGDLMTKVYLYINHYKTNNESIKLYTVFISFEFFSLILGDLWCMIYYLLIVA